jgi:LuxR family transcriptional regulator, maltose regulon positive regulatory protein
MESRTRSRGSTEPKKKIIRLQDRPAGTAPPLLRTKLQRPRLVPNVVPRPHLVERLNAGLDRRLTLVCAPAGFGKTTLLSAWLEQCPRDSAWLSLDGRDAEPVVFLTYFIAALQTVFPGAAGETLASLQATALPPWPVIISSLINEICDLPRPFILVLDDYHALQRPEIDDLLTELLLHGPVSMHLVIASREDPLLSLASLRGWGLVAEIRGRGLRFTREEIAAYLRQLDEGTVSEEMVARLEAQTEGWVTGLYLATLPLRDPDLAPVSPAGALAGNRYVTEYLEEQILPRMSGPLQDFLLKTSVLNQLNADLCRAVVGPGDELDCQDTLETLERTNLFTTALDDRGQWYRYHHLFQDFLRQHLGKRHSVQEIAALHRRASAWYADNGLVEEALPQALAAGDADRAAALVEAQVHPLLNRALWRTLQEWMGMLPDEVAAQRPALLLARCWLLGIRFEWAAIPPLLGQVEALLQVAPAPGEAAASLGAEIDAIWGACLDMQDRFQEALPRLRRALEYLPAEYAYARGNTVKYLALALHSTGHPEEAVRSLDEALARAGDRADSAYILQLHQGKSWLLMWSGDLAGLAQAAGYMASLARAQGEGMNEGWAHYFLGYVHYEWNDLEAAARHYARVVELRYRANAFTFHSSLLGLALVRQGQGRAEEADRCAAEAVQLATDMQQPASVPYAQSLQLRLALLRGNVRPGMSVAGVTYPSSHARRLVRSEVPELTQAWFLIIQRTEDSLRAAGQLLRAILDLATSAHDTRRTIETLALRSLWFQARGQTASTLETLARAVALARPGGFIRTFADLGPEMAVMLDRLRGQGVAGDYLERVLHAFPTAGPAGPEERTPPASELPEPLTPREAEILELLAQRLSDKEIAAMLVVSHHTIRRHVNNIYQKLGVNGRRQAVAKAVALGLLPARRD